MMETQLQMIFIVLIIITLIIFSFTVFTLIKNIELLKKDPINYGIEKNDFDSCVCYGYMGTVFYGLNMSDYLTKTNELSTESKVKIDLSNLSFNLIKGE